MDKFFIRHNGYKMYEINNKEYFLLCKFCENKDYISFFEIIYSLIPYFKNLNIFEKIETLLIYRSIFISDTIKFISDKGINTTIPVYHIIDNISKHNQTYTTFQYNNIDITILSPKWLHGEPNHNIYDVDIEMSAKIDIPISIINTKLFEHFNKFNQITIINSQPQLEIDEQKINILSEQFTEFIMDLFKQDLNNLFEQKYVFARNFYSIDYESLSPLDTQILESILYKELKESQDAQQNENVNMPMAPITPIS